MLTEEKLAVTRRHIYPTPNRRNSAVKTDLVFVKSLRVSVHIVILIKAAEWIEARNRCTFKTAGIGIIICIECPSYIHVVQVIGSG